MRLTFTVAAGVIWACMCLDLVVERLRQYSLIFHPLRRLYSAFCPNTVLEPHSYIGHCGRSLGEKAG